jgi:Sulfotransferase domain
LKLALDELGFPTLHTQHLYEYQNVIDMWTNEIFLPSIRDEKASLGLPDFQVLLDEGFSATADLPMALYYEEILQEFPDCKFILTTRSNSEEWFRSWDTLTKSITETTNLGGFVFSNVRQYSHYLRWLFAVVNKDDSYLTRPFPLPHQNAAVAMQSYEDHNRRVREVTPPNQLLEYNVKQGWEPLCKFLEIEECPDTSFPKTNSARSIQIQAISAFYTPIIAVLCFLVYMFSRIFKKSTGLTVVQWANWKSKELNLTLRKTMLGEKIHMDGTSCVSKKV